MSYRMASALALTAGLIALMLALTIHPAMLVDDAAITLRYAERLAAGQGFTYNDHERVLGASNPLLVMSLALLVRVGADPVAASTMVGFLAYAGCAAVAVWLTARMSGTAGALVTATALTGDGFFRAQALNGLEVGLSGLIGLCVVAAMTEDRDVAAGALMAVALLNKLDAAALLSAACLAAYLVRRRMPARFLASTIVIIAPWLLWAWWSVGSPLPHSVTAKLTAGEGYPFDPWWVVRFLMSGPRRYCLLAVPLAFLASAPVKAPRSLTIVALLGWTLLHGIAYSAIDLGAPYSWYLAVPVAPLAVVAGIAIGAYSTTHRVILRGAAIVLAVAITATAVMDTSTAWRTRRLLQPWEAFDADRRLAGVFLRQFAAPGEIVESAYGWPAYESRLPFNDAARLNSVVLRQPVSYRVEHGDPYQDGAHAPQTPEGMVPLAAFNLANRLFPGYSWFVVFGHPDSAIARSGVRSLPDQIQEKTLRDPRLRHALRRNSDEQLP